MCLAVPGKIVSIYTSGSMRMAKIDFGGVNREVCLEAIPEAKIGEYVIVHAGFALNTLSEEEAAETMKVLNELADVEAELGLV